MNTTTTIMKYNHIALLFAASLLATSACSPEPAAPAKAAHQLIAPGSPASVAGQKIVLDYQDAQTREGYHAEPIRWEPWKKMEGKSADVSAVFGRNNRPNVAFTPTSQEGYDYFMKNCNPNDAASFIGMEAGEVWTYTKTGEFTAELKIEGMESCTTYKLEFATPTLGMATCVGEGEGMYWETKNIVIRLVKP